MFGWFKKKESDAGGELRETMALCIEIFRRTWLDAKHSSPTAIELASEMEVFSASAFHLMYEKFPITRQAPPMVLWLTVFTAVAEAKTHSQDLVNGAVEILRQKYAHGDAV